MSEEDPDVIAVSRGNPAPKRGGWPRGKPRLRQTPVAAPARETPKRSRWTMKAGANWESNDVGVEDRADRLHIPREEFPEGMDFYWMANTVMGLEQTQARGQFERKGWTPVHSSEDFGGAFDGRFMPKGFDGEINVDGLVLMARPLELSIKARKRDEQRAREQVLIKEQALRGGDLPVSLDPAHPSAVGSNRINRTYERIEVPSGEDE